MKRTKCMAILALLFIGTFLFSGCAAPMLMAVGYGATGAGVGIMGKSAYDAANDDKDRSKLAEGQGQGLANISNVPTEMLYAASTSRCSEAITSVLLESGESVVTATETYIKTEKFRETTEVGAISAMFGKAEVYTTKAIILARKDKHTKVSVKVDVTRKTVFTQETKKIWPEFEARVRNRFFTALSKKIRPAKLAKR